MKATDHPELFSEHAADQQVIKSLHRHIDKLNKELNMQIVKTTTGDFYRVREEDKLTADQVVEVVAKKQAELSALEAILPADNGGDNGQPADQGAAPADGGSAANDGAAPGADGSAPAAPAADPNAPAQGDAPAAPAVPADSQVADPAANANNGQAAPAQPQAPNLQ